MKKLLLLAPLLALVPACSDDQPKPPGDQEPFRSDWQTVANWPFDPGAVATLNVGGIETSDNYANRGDIEVYYTLTENRIVVQMREFSFAPDLATAEEDFETLEPWMYTASSPQPPDELEASSPDANCQYIDPAAPDVAVPWPDGCYVRAYYRGQIQLQRAGADIRVFLPVGWEGDLNLITQDNLAEPEDYPDRGDITIAGLAGSASVALDSGEVDIRLDPNIEPVPICSAQQNADCEAVGWDTTDPSCTACTTFGRIRVTTRGEQPITTTIDAPASLWVNGTFDNTQPGLNPSSEPTCTLDVDCDGFGGCNWIEMEASQPWKGRVELNKPSASLEGLGYNLNVVSGACAEIEVANSPDDFMMPVSEVRGDSVLCTGCLADLSIPDAPAAP